MNLAQQLDKLNVERRSIEASMLEQALELLKNVRADSGLTFFDPAWHQGVVGILASRLKDRMHRPVICFAPAEESGRPVLRGSGRSIPGLHLRDCLDLVSKRSPGLIARFGGHAMAAGLTIKENAFREFGEAFEAAVGELLPAEARLRTVETDGALDGAHFSLEVARMLDGEIWGQGFPLPLFCDNFAVEAQRVVGEKHLKLRLLKDGRRFEAMRFGALEALPGTIRAAYRLAVNDFNGLKTIQLNVEHFE
jgi:single-stranded-DNA-specific exonuclease